jgi:serine/threonine-protein kinase
LLADRRPWVATELVAGISLSRVIERWPLTPHEVATLIWDLSEILEHAHRRGVVHGGLGPDAIIIPDNAARFPVCLGDWSEARAVDSTSPTPMLPRLPTRPFHAPEQRNGGPLDGRVDVYALGVVAYLALHGSLPDPSRAEPVGTTDIPPMLAALIEQMLAQDSASRPTSTKVRTAAELVLGTFEEARDDDAALVVDSPLEQILFELDDDVEIPVVVDVPSRPVRPRTISSEQAVEVAGEIET